MPSTASSLRRISGTLHDLRGKGHDDCLAPDDWSAVQRLAAALRAAGSDGIVYPSVRWPAGPGGGARSGPISCACRSSRAARSSIIGTASACRATSSSARMSGAHCRSMIEPMTTLDPRLHAFRPDLADIRLKGAVEAARFVEGTPRRVVAAAAPIKRVPRSDAGLESEALLGETVTGLRGWRRGLVVGPARDRFLCRLCAHRRASAECARADPPRHGAPHLPLSRPRPEAAGPRLPVAGQPPGARRHGRDARHGLSPACRRRGRRRRGPCRAARRPAGERFRRRRRALPRHALSLGRAHQHRARLLGPRAALPDGRRSFRARATPTCRRP